MYVYCFILQPRARACTQQEKRCINTHKKAQTLDIYRLNYLLNIDSLDRVREVFKYSTLGSTPDVCYFKCLLDVFKGVYVYLYMCSKCSGCSHTY